MTATPLLAVFVPTAIGAGLVASIVLVVVDSISQLRSTEHQRRSTAVLAASTAAAVRDGSAARASRVGVRSRRRAVVAGLVVGGIGVYGLVGSFWNYWNPDERLRGLAWLWAGSWVAASALVAIGVACLVIGCTGRPLRGLRRHLVLGTPLGTIPVERTAVAVPAADRRAQEVLGEEEDRGTEEQAGDHV